MAKEPSISFIGSGNLAWHLAPALDNVGYTVKEVFSPNPKHAAQLTERLYQAEVKASLDFSTSASQIFIIATSDEAIQSIAQEIILPEEATLLHTSGSVSIQALQYAATPHVGVLYPLQTFTKSKRIEFKSMPIFVEAISDETAEIVIPLAKAISQNVYKINSEERKSLHLAAVFAANFTNHMLTLSKKIMDQNSLDFEWLKPLITEQINKSLSIGPEQAQTGPARRGDLEILDAHLESLQEDPEVAELYKVISQHILNQYSS